jgi:hypothetical protein
MDYSPTLLCAYPAISWIAMTEDDTHDQNESTVLELNEQAAQLAIAFAEFANGYRRFINGLAEAARPYLEAASRVDWVGVVQGYHAGMKRHIEAGRTLASKGWTIPGWIYYSELIDLSQMADTDIDDYFTTAYSENGFERLKKLSASLVQDSGFEPWKTTIEQAEECITAGKHQVTIPALLSILEGYTIRNMIKPIGRDAKRPHLLDHLKKLQKRAFDNGDMITLIPAIPWTSAFTFLGNLFETYWFDEPAPSFINRHWVLHGRSEVDWKLADALRLLTALDTLSRVQRMLDMIANGEPIR